MNNPTSFFPDVDSFVAIAREAGPFLRRVFTLESPEVIGKTLIVSAREAAQNAYCPYSHFHVGAAVLCDDGTIVKGCNVENSSYGLTICAERNAIFAAQALGRRIVAIAVTTPDAPGEPTSCCGACRQVIAEFLQDNSPVFLDNRGWVQVKDILPDAFRFAGCPGSSAVAAGTDS